MHFTGQGQLPFRESSMIQGNLESGMLGDLVDDTTAPLDVFLDADGAR